MRLQGKQALVTGGGSGQGREVAMAFAREGAVVVVTDIDLGAASDTVRQIVVAGGHANAVRLDISDDQEWREVAAGLAADDRDLHVLYNNAAVFPAEDRGTVDTPIEVWDRVMAVNLRGTFLACQTAVPFMRNGGSIINVASIRAWLGTTTPHHAYASSKAAMLGLASSMAVELGPKDIRVNSICPGTIETGMAQAHDPAARALRIVRYPLGRFGTPADVAPAAVYFASDESRWITGAVLNVDGGTSALYA